MTEKNTQSHTC